MIANTQRPLRPFLDVLFCIIVVLMGILLLMKIPTDEGIKMPKIAARAMVIIEWEDGSADIDLVGKDPSHFIVFHRSREGGNRQCFMSLDHDDLGDKNDSAARKDNQEIIQIRDFVEGDYHFTIHYYSWDNYDPSDSGEETTVIPVSVKLVLIRPNHKVLHEAKVVLEKVGEEKTLVRFTVGPDKKTVSNINTEEGSVITSYSQVEIQDY